MLGNYDGTGFGGIPTLSFRNGRGSSGAQLASQSGDTIGLVEFLANRGGTVTRPATIAAVTTEKHTVLAQGGALKFSTISNGTTSLLERMRVDNSDFVGIGTTSPSTALQVNETVTATAFSGSGASLTGVTSPSGTSCGGRYVSCSVTTPTYDANSDSITCVGNTLTATCAAPATFHVFCAAN